jgi:hypothetical protein
MSQELSIKDEIRLHEKKGLKSVWTNPATTWERSDDDQLVRPRTIYAGERSSGTFGLVPTWEDPIFDMNASEEGKKQLKSGSTDTAKITVDPYIGAWKNIAHEYADLVESAIKSGSRSALKSAGVGMSDGFSAIDVINITNKLLGTELRPFGLEEAVTTVAVPNLIVSYDTFTRFTASRNIGEGVPPVLKLGELSREQFELPKDGGAVALTFEAQTRASHDIMRLHIDTLVSDLRRIKAEKIAVEIETAADVTGADFEASTGGDSTNKPLEAIGAVADTLWANNATFDTIASHDRVFRAYISNTWTVKYTTTNPQTTSFANNKVISGVPGLPGITWYIDNTLTDSLLTVYDKSAIVKFQGPVRTAVVREEMQDVDAFRIFDFNLPKVLEPAKVRNITGVTA